MFKKSIYRVIVSAVMGVILFGASNKLAFAADDDIDYQFTIYGNHANSYSAARYRQTTYIWNEWKVNLQSSTEGEGTIMTFWLALDDGNYVASDFHDVTQGSGSHYYWAYDSASETDVKLAAENNNYTTNSYTISGIWDEETD
jgi:hypothetical protein